MCSFRPVLSLAASERNPSRERGGALEAPLRTASHSVANGQWGAPSDLPPRRTAVPAPAAGAARGGSLSPPPPPRRAAPAERSDPFAFAAGGAALPLGWRVSSPPGLAAGSWLGSWKLAWQLEAGLAAGSWLGSWKLAWQLESGLAAGSWLGSWKLAWQLEAPAGLAAGSARDPPSRTPAAP
eukprot:gene13546-biopygen13388